MRTLRWTIFVVIACLGSAGMVGCDRAGSPGSTPTRDGPSPSKPGAAATPGSTMPAPSATMPSNPPAEKGK